MREEAKLWYDSSKYDLECAKAMLTAKKYNYAVFFCHQSVEKILKAIILSKKNNPPKTHDLKELLAQARTGVGKEAKNFILRLNPHYLITRYPDVSGTVGYENYDEKIAIGFVAETEKV